MTTMESKEAVRKLREKYPAMRRTKPVAIVHSGSRRRVERCICGRGPGGHLRQPGNSRAGWVALYDAGLLRPPEPA
jgi:hypothetical protein